MFKTGEEALTWVMKRTGKGKGFVSFLEVMEKIGNPQDQLKTIHVAGTNGKGSTVQFIQSILAKSGFKVGTFTSPHLLSHLDRIRCDGKWIEEEVFLRILNQHYDLIQEYQLGMFEIDTLIMFVYFKEQKVDFAVVEAGIGGRYDSTNCMSSPIVSVITSIGHDHSEMLGDTIEKVAFQKSGIIKKGGCCVVGKIPDAAYTIIQEEARKQNAKLILAKELGEEIKLQSDALYQRQNAAIAYEVILQLEKIEGIKILSQHKKEGLETSIWPGRYDVMSQYPRIILDGAHNQQGIEALTQSLKNEGKPLVIIFSALKDKPVIEMLMRLEDVADMIYVVEFDFYRALPLTDYPQSKKIIRCKDFDDAFQSAKNSIRDEGCLCICGSLYFISEVYAQLKK